MERVVDVLAKDIAKGKDIYIEWDDKLQIHYSDQISLEVLYKKIKTWYTIESNLYIIVW